MTHDTLIPVPPGPAGPPVRRPVGTDPGARPALRALGVAMALALVGYGAIVVVSLLARVTAHSSATYAGLTSVEFDVGFEAVEIAGSATDGSVTLERSSAWSLTRPTAGQHRDGDRLVVTSRCPVAGLGCSGRIRLVVPPELAVLVAASAGSVRVHDTTGPVTLVVDDAHVTLSRLAGAVAVRTSDGGVTVSDLIGRLTIRTSDGAVDGTGLRSRLVEVQSSDGAVRLGFASPPDLVTVRSRDGSVRVLVPDDRTSYQVAATTSDSDRTITVPTDAGSDHVLDLQTSDGSITVGTAE
ncbi:MAG: DUF4097 family beta strand repeat-containing protein [Cellulomonas sp.]